MKGSLIHTVPLLVLALLPAAVHAAPQDGGMSGMPKGTTPLSMDGMSMSRNSMPMSMPSSIDLLDPMSRESSGTAWNPDSTPLYGKMFMRGGDMLMVHGAIFPRFTYVGSARGDQRLDAPNWFMAMFGHPLSGNSQLGIRLMMSLDPLIEGKRGYPLLFQTGESAGGVPLHDRQHPHDLFDELSATYSRAFGGGNSAYLYLAYPGEPALGPPTFMHRLSAMDEPDAPIGHHWQDATHITFGVITLGAAHRNVKLEGSLFTGREPDEYRYNFDPIRLNSYSGRVLWNPGANLALQISHGFIRGPEALDPTVNVHRTTASVLYNRPLGPDANWSNSLVWGRNDDNEVGINDSYLFETNYQRAANTWYARLEQVQKSGHELVLNTPALDHALFNVGSYGFGYVRDLRHDDASGIDVGLGGQLTLYDRPAGLQPFYGSGTPVGFELFFRLRPSRLDRPPSTSTGRVRTGHSRSGPSPLAASPFQITAAMQPNPPVAGENQLDLQVTDAGTGRGVTGLKFTAAVSMTSMDMGTSHPPVTETGAGHYSLPVTFTMAGPWQVILTGTGAAGQPVTKTFQYDVQPKE